MSKPCADGVDVDSGAEQVSCRSVTDGVWADPFLLHLGDGQPRLISVDLHDVALAEALNAIAAKHGFAIWQYAEDKDGEYSLLFVSR